MQAEQHLRFGPYRLALGAQQLWRGTLEVSLTPKALAVLRVLVARPGEVVTKEEFFQRVWGDTVVSDDALAACIQELRRALRDDARNPRFIETAHRRGYRFIGKVVSDQLSVGSQTEEVVSSQHSVASGQEEDRNTKQAEGLRLKAEGLPPSSPLSLSQLGSLDDAQQNPGEESESATTALPFPASSRIWVGRSLVWLAVVLVIGVSATALYRVSIRNPPAPSVGGLSQIPDPEALPLPDKPSIAIMPFTNMSGDPEQEYFSDGLTDDLITALSRLSQLFVIARHSTFTYKGKAVKVQEVSRELGVRYVLEGSVRKTEDQVRINAQLVDATTGHHVWAERYDQPLKDIFTLQDEIVQKIVTTLKLQLTLRAQGVLVRKATDNLQAYDYYLQGREYRNRFTKEANAQARQMYERAVALDPAYAEAYAELGWTYYVEWDFQWSQDPQALERALALGQKALALDDSLARTHGLLGFVYARKQQSAQAIVEGERAIALDPNNADGYALQAGVLLFASRSEDALQAIEQAMRLNPHYPAWYLQQLGNAYQQTGRYEEAIAAHKQLLVRNPNFLWAYPNLAGNYLTQWISQLSLSPVTLELALETAQRAVALNDSLSMGHIALGSVYLVQKQYEPAIAEMERAISLDSNLANGYAGLAYTLGCAGRSENALRMVEQALRLKPLTVDNHLGSVGAVYYLVGRPSEAIAPLKQYLTRYPNHLGPHLTLAAVYGELGKEAEARAEVVEVLRLNPKFSLEVHKEKVPIKDPATLEWHVAALRKAGLK
jgi:TolB-like protein/DNA-binding winged helix-turn-helix (wHTH) protein/Flp pilus assembly protein TadD